MRYRCLVLDHDDTVVNSTAALHYPAFLQSLAVLRPGMKLTLEDYFRCNCDPGFAPFCEGTLGFTPADMEWQTKNWLRQIAGRVPPAFPGIRELLGGFCAQGGELCVISHSVRENILRDYRENGLPAPRLVFGWEQPPEHRKPNRWPLQEVLRQLRLRPEEVLVVDDLKPGLQMARACGVDFACAGWAHQIPGIRSFMEWESRYYCKTVADLAPIVRGEPPVGKQEEEP